MKNRMTVYHYNTVQEFYESGRDLYRIKSTTGWREWVRLRLLALLRVLGVLSVYHPQSTSQVTTVEIRADELANSILEYGAAIECMWQTKARTLLIGYDVYSNLVKQEMNRLRPFYLQTHQLVGGFRNGRSEIQLCDLKLVVVPWLNGVVAVPDLSGL